MIESDTDNEYAFVKDCKRADGLDLKNCVFLTVNLLFMLSATEIQ